MLKLSDYIVSLIEEQKTGVRREIRLAKTELKMLDKYIKGFRGMSDSEIEESLSENPDVLNQYRELRKKVSEVENKELSKMVRTGKLREVFYDKDGKEIKELNQEQPND